jgi:hypothetical protein
MYMTPQQALAQYYQRQQPGLQPAQAQPTFSNLPTSGAPVSAGANNYAQTVLGNQPATGGVNALAQQMQANRQLQRQIGYGGQPMPVTQQPSNVSQMMQQFAGPQPQAAAPGQPVGAATAAPQPMPGMPMQPMQQQRGMGQWGGGLGTGAANTLARYYQR